MVTVLQKEFLVQWRNFHDFAGTVFSWVNEEIAAWCGSIYGGNNSVMWSINQFHTEKGKEFSGSVFYRVIKVFKWCPIAGSKTLSQTQMVSNV